MGLEPTFPRLPLSVLPLRRISLTCNFLSNRLYGPLYGQFVHEVYNLNGSLLTTQCSIQLLFNGSAGGIRIHTVRILSSSSPAYWTTAPYFQDQQFSLQQISSLFYLIPMVMTIPGVFYTGFLTSSSYTLEKKFGGYISTNMSSLLVSSSAFSRTWNRLSIENDKSHYEPDGRGIFKRKE